MGKFRIEYDNDTGPNDEGFSEHWLVTDDNRSFRVDSSRQDAEWLAGVLNAPPAAAVPASLHDAPPMPMHLREVMPELVWDAAWRTLRNALNERDQQPAAAVPDRERVAQVISPECVKVEPYPPRNQSPGGQHVGSGPAGVKVTHLPTGLFATCESERSQHYNRQKALRELEALLAKQAPPAAAVLSSLRVGNLPTMNQDEYPGLGEWWVNVRSGDDVVFRAYGSTPQEAMRRAHALAAALAGKEGE